MESHGLLLRRERGRGKPALKVIELQKKEVQEAAKAATSQLPRCLGRGENHRKQAKNHSKPPKIIKKTSKIT